jgi:hypothetical protein
MDPNTLPPVLFPRPGTADRFLPGHRVQLSGGDPELVTPDTIDSTDATPFPGLLGLGDWLSSAASDLPAERARAAAIAAIVDRVHEVIEWTRCDGEPLAQAHPDGAAEEDAWAFLAEAAGDLLDVYANTWPAPGSIS